MFLFFFSLYAHLSWEWLEDKMDKTTTVGSLRNNSNGGHHHHHHCIKTTLLSNDELGLWLNLLSHKTNKLHLSHSFSLSLSLLSSHSAPHALFHSLHPTSSSPSSSTFSALHSQKANESRWMCGIFHGPHKPKRHGASLECKR